LSLEFFYHDRLCLPHVWLDWSSFRSRQGLILENLALRQQLLALHVKRPRRRLLAMHKLFWVALRWFWSGWKKPLVPVTPRTVVEWHRAGFLLYWKCLSRARQVGGRKSVSRELRALIFRMASENPTWRPRASIANYQSSASMYRSQPFQITQLISG
jgi:hypothetical protein